MGMAIQIPTADELRRTVRARSEELRALRRLMRLAEAAERAEQARLRRLAIQEGRRQCGEAANA
jgi:hypothetical protein